MSVKSFKFVSPGVFINEIDNSFIPRSAEAIGPVVIGRSARGPAMTPVKVQSFSEYINIYGDTVPGNAGGDVYRNGNEQSPMYGTYAAKAFLNANVAPLTYMRLLGHQHTDADDNTTAKAGWKTLNATKIVATGGGAYALWVFDSASITYHTGSGNGGASATTGSSANLGTGSLAAIFYCTSGSAVVLSGSRMGLAQKVAAGAINRGGQNIDAFRDPKNIAANGALIQSDSNGRFTIRVVSSSVEGDTVVGDISGYEELQFGFDDGAEDFVRKVCNTNPQLTSTKGAFYPTSAYKPYWLGESFSQFLRYGGGMTANGEAAGGLDLTNRALYGVMLPLSLSGSATTGPHNMLGQQATDGKTGWFISQDSGPAAALIPENLQKLFRLVGRGHGEWLHKNLKVSIERIRPSNTLSTDFGSFSVVLRMANDTDTNVQVVERYDNCNINPASPDYVARRIGTEYSVWSDTDRRLRFYGDYKNQSKFVRVEMNEEVDNGATDASLLPFGYQGPPVRKPITGASKTNKNWSGSLGAATDGQGSIRNRFVGTTSPLTASSTNLLSGSNSGGGGTRGPAIIGNTGSAVLFFPTDRLRHSASDGGAADPTNSYFGYNNRRKHSSTIADRSAGDSHRLLGTALGTGVDEPGYIFTLDNVRKDSSNNYYYHSGSRKGASSVTAESGKTYKDLLDANYNRFTAPFFGGFDGLNIKLPDPFYNEGMTGAPTETNNAAYYTIKRAIDTLSDPEFADINLMTMPGLTTEGLTTHMVNVCEERADALAVIDLPNIYTPTHEKYESDRTARVGKVPRTVATALRNRRLESSYGCTFYPWVQTRDQRSGQLVWIPPSVAMIGTFASSQAASQLWFAPAGFNRGGLTEGAAGIPITNVSERLISKDRDTLYEANINPIASFPSSGIVVFGQKTLQTKQSALDRINVRRLVIFMKKQISILSTRVLFEQNVPETWNRFKSLIEPFLANVKTDFGITDYKLILDETTTTPDLIDQNILYAKIMIKPARAIEYIAIDFVIASTGASFED